MDIINKASDERSHKVYNSRLKNHNRRLLKPGPVKLNENHGFFDGFSDFEAVFVTHNELCLQKTNEAIRKKGEKATFRLSVNSP